MAKDYEINRSFTLLDYFEFDSYFLNSNHLCLKYNFINQTDFGIVNNYK